jgi:hypothetical protein
VRWSCRRRTFRLAGSRSSPRRRSELGCITLVGRRRDDEGDDEVNLSLRPEMKGASVDEEELLSAGWESFAANDVKGFRSPRGHWLASREDDGRWSLYRAWHPMSRPEVFEVRARGLSLSMVLAEAETEQANSASA